MADDDLDVGKAVNIAGGAKAFQILKQAAKKGSAEMLKTASKRAIGVAGSAPLVGDMLSPDEANAFDDEEAIKSHGKKKEMSEIEKKMLLEQEEEDAMVDAFEKRKRK